MPDHSPKIWGQPKPKRQRKPKVPAVDAQAAAPQPAETTADAPEAAQQAPEAAQPELAPEPEP